MANPYYSSDAHAIRQMGVTDLGTEHWLNDPSQMRFGFQTNFGGGEGTSDEDWTVQEESAEPTGDTPTVHPDELAAAATATTPEGLVPILSSNLRLTFPLEPAAAAEA